mmetsp:Transcript_66323/g.184756  ORF Transcript_66323/g.184756 Transcript_66323/m.184756 type:complete len:212 (+) Transcript_66323:2042-2677(+)
MQQGVGALLHEGFRCACEARLDDSRFQLDGVHCGAWLQVALQLRHGLVINREACSRVFDVLPFHAFRHQRAGAVNDLGQLRCVLLHCTEHAQNRFLCGDDESHILCFRHEHLQTSRVALERPKRNVWSNAVGLRRVAQQLLRCGRFLQDFNGSLHLNLETGHAVLPLQILELVCPEAQMHLQHSCKKHNVAVLYYGNFVRALHNLFQLLQL